MIDSWRGGRAVVAFAALVWPAACTCGPGTTGATDGGPGGDAGGADGGVDASADGGGAGGDGGGAGGDGGGGGSDAANGGDGGLGAGECRGDGDCAPMDYCRGPDELPICGACRVPATPCFADAECAGVGATYVCAPLACSCTGEGECVPGCTGDGDCDTTWQECAADYHCRGRTCAGGAFVCPEPFDCDPGTGLCTRRTCSSDAVCAGNYCVEGACYAVPGSCNPCCPP